LISFVRGFDFIERDDTLLVDRFVFALFDAYRREATFVFERSVEFDE